MAGKKIVPLETAKVKGKLFSTTEAIFDREKKITPPSFSWA